MSTSPQNNRENFDDLLIQQAIYGLNAEERKQLEDFRREIPLDDNDRFEATVGALDAGFFGCEHGQESSVGTLALPANLRSKIIADSDSFLSNSSESSISDETRHSESKTDAPSQAIDSKIAQGGWSVREKFFGLITAASLLFALASFAGLFEAAAPKPLTVAQQLQEFQGAGHSDIRTASWTNPTGDAASVGASGEVVWSDSQQRGFMVFDGLQVNNASEQQYQLWIFDSARDDALPVDGGVFDITTDGKVIVPIDSKLSITQAKMFAVTIEVPGGVVQSKRERLPLLATVDL